MLTLLGIRNFATIEESEVEFADGLNVLTGETGAGKSIVVDALSLLLGERADPAMVRTGADKAIVQGIFEGLGEGLEELGGLPGVDLSHQLIVSREVSREGRSVARVDGQIVPLRTLRALGDALVDVHGQGEHLSLFRVGEQLEILDRYAKATALRSRFTACFEELCALREKLVSLRSTARDRSRRIDVLRYQVDEITAARLELGEDQSLRTERDRLGNAGRLIELAESAYENLYGGDDSATEKLGRVVSELSDLARLDEAAPASDFAERSLSLSEDLARVLRTYRETLEFDPNRLDQIESRLDEIERLKRKYGATVNEVIAFAADAERELGKLERGDIETADLENRVKKVTLHTGKTAIELSRIRRAAAAQLPQRVTAELSELGIEHACMEVAVIQVPSEDESALETRVDDATSAVTVACNATGIDRVELLLSANPGESLRPLARIASGGEAARIMLALKVILAEADRVPTLVFDEVDAGVGGRMGAVIGQKLWIVARSHQVICVSHLAQLAAYADRHLSVRKSESDGRVRTTVTSLGNQGRISEMAAMLGAATETGERTAREMLKSAAGLKHVGIQASLEPRTP